MAVTSRRQLFQLGFVAAAAAGPFALPQRVLAAAKPTRLSRKAFTPLVGASFSVTGDSTHQAVLRSVGDLPHSQPGDPYRFRLLFSMAGGPEQGTYLFRARTLSQQLFVVPVGPDVTVYEAVVVS